MKMEVTVMDAVFGEMTYKHRWFKTEILNIFEKDFSVRIVAKAFSGKPITDEQRDAYKWFKENLGQINETMTQLASGYINENCQEFDAHGRRESMLTAHADLEQIITPRTLLFTKDGGILVLFDCPWDEHGIAIQLKPEIEIGCQDIFL